MFSWFTSTEEIQKHQKALNECKEKVKSFGTLSFGERHHPWIRHITIESYFNEEEVLCFSFQGPTVQYRPIPFECQMWNVSIMNSKESLEDSVAEVFLCHQYVNPQNVISRDKHDFETRHRLALYLDYKFYKAMNKKE